MRYQTIPRPETPPSPPLQKKKTRWNAQNKREKRLVMRKLMSQLSSQNFLSFRQSRLILDSSTAGNVSQIDGGSRSRGSSGKTRGSQGEVSVTGPFVVRKSGRVSVMWRVISRAAAEA